MDDLTKVLVVDDEPDLLELTKLFLENAGSYQVQTVGGGPEALAALEGSPYDAVVSDYQMPGMDGIELLKNVRSRHGALPFILFTGKGREEVVIDALNAGADFYLQKGGNMAAQAAELSHKINQAVARRRAESALCLAEFSVSRSTIPTIWFDHRSRLVKVNKAACRHLGYTEDELLRMSLPDIDPSIRKERWDSIWREMEKAGSVHVRTSERRKDGSEVKVEVDISILELAGQKYAFSFIRDMTEQLASEARLMKAEVRHRGILFAVPDVISTVDRNLTILTINKIPDGGRPSPIGSSILEYIDPQHHELVRSTVEKVFSTGLRDSYEIIGRGLSGGDRRYESNLAPLVTDGVVTAVVLVGRDVTDRRRAEEALPPGGQLSG
jgi:PAS domain S-box-containing protein